MITDLLASVYGGVPPHHKVGGTVALSTSPPPGPDPPPDGLDPGLETIRRLLHLLGFLPPGLDLLDTGPEARLPLLIRPVLEVGRPESLQYCIRSLTQIGRELFPEHEMNFTMPIMPSQRD